LRRKRSIPEEAPERVAQKLERLFSPEKPFLLLSQLYWVTPWNVLQPLNTRLVDCLRAPADEDWSTFDDNPCATMSTQESDPSILCWQSEGALLPVRVRLVREVDLKIQERTGLKRGLVKYFGKRNCQVICGNCQSDVA
jgi:hypothetical protein